MTPLSESEVRAIEKALGGSSSSESEPEPSDSEPEPSEPEPEPKEAMNAVDDEAAMYEELGEAMRSSDDRMTVWTSEMTTSHAVSLGESDTGLPAYLTPYNQVDLLDPLRAVAMDIVRVYVTRGLVPR